MKEYKVIYESSSQTVKEKFNEMRLLDYLLFENNQCEMEECNNQMIVDSPISCLFHNFFLDKLDLKALICNIIIEIEIKFSRFEEELWSSRWGNY